MSYFHNVQRERLWPMSQTTLEREYQAELIEHLGALFPGCIILKNDTDYQQGIPDLTFLFETHWALLEVKAFADARKRPNQAYFIEKADGMSFGAFIYPENEQEVLYDLQRAFGVER